MTTEEFCSARWSTAQSMRSTNEKWKKWQALEIWVGRKQQDEIYTRWGNVESGKWETMFESWDNISRETLTIQDIDCVDIISLKSGIRSVVEEKSEKGRTTIQFLKGKGSEDVWWTLNCLQGPTTFGREETERTYRLYWFSWESNKLSKRGLVLLLR